MTISVVIPTCNRAHNLARALDSVVNQRSAVDEIIVVDDGSTDHTRKLVSEQYPAVTLITQPNRGVSNARNRGISVARGDWIALLDSDDEWLSLKIEKQITAIANTPGTRVCHTDEIWIRNGKRVNAKNRHRKYGGNIYHHCLPLCAMSPSSILLHRSLFDEFGLFDDSLPACEDYDMWLRLTATVPVLYVDQPLLQKYGGHADQLSARYWGMDRFRLRALEKALLSGQLDEEQYRLTKDTMASKLEVLCQGIRKRKRASEAEWLEKRYRPLISPSDSPAPTAR